jgi:hypothetical protein
LIACFFLISCSFNNPEFPQGNLPLNDSDYPYAGIPRIVIETKDFRQIRDKDTKIPGHFQIYGSNAPETGVWEMTIRGRGNSSFKMPKYGYKIKFSEKREIFGMSANREWVLLANFRDKTHLKNFISSQLAETLGDEYSTRSKFVELYINREYLGLYQLSENVKVGKNRVNIKDSDFLLEKTTESGDKPYFTTNQGNLFEIKSPKNSSDSDVAKVKKHLDDFENFIASRSFAMEELEKWLDIEDFIRYYWIQELSKNLDGKFQRSVFVTWEQDGIIKMGPVWDFDLGYGIGMVGVTTTPQGWEIRKTAWFKRLWENRGFAVLAKDYWKNHLTEFISIIDSIGSSSQIIQQAVTNDNKRWPVLDTDENLYHETKYHNYPEAIDSLKSWVRQRINWIDSHLD